MPKLLPASSLSEAIRVSFDDGIARVENQAKPEPFKTVGIVGAGLIGGSFALALKRAGLCERIIASGRQQSSLLNAKALGVIDDVVTMEYLAAHANLIFIAVPVKAFGAVFEQLVPSLSEKAIITDGGSTKYDLIVEARAILGERIRQFVPLHPIAGSHQSGAAAARSDLYEDRKLIITPLEENSLEDIGLMAATWQAIGAAVYCMDAQIHDKIFAATSHFPHYICAAYMNNLLATEHSDLFLTMAGTGFKDFTRIAASSPEMWNDIFYANKAAMLQQLDGFMQQLTEARAYLEDNQEDKMFDWFKQASDARKNWHLKS
ncbi:MAG: prephenate dehydrogenase/arogenate dehydrogenase family protein [Alcaligenaceae bacterium]|nr:prephenate dehydrogenase/arogenate dehydrogenase family protein [Alcaligenaceae bacterium]